MNKKQIFTYLKFFGGAIFFSVLCYMSAISLYFLNIKAVVSVVFSFLCLTLCFAFGYRFAKYLNSIFKAKMYFFLSSILISSFYVYFLIDFKKYNFFVEKYLFTLIFFVVISGVVVFNKKRDSKMVSALCLLPVLLTWI